MGLLDNFRVSLPTEVRSSTFRFRFVPNIAEDARLGVDALSIRRL